MTPAREPTTAMCSVNTACFQVFSVAYNRFQPALRRGIGRSRRIDRIRRSSERKEREMSAHRKFIVVTAALAAMALPSAAHALPQNSAYGSQPYVASQAQPAIAGYSGQPEVVVTASASGFSWSDAAIGAMRRPRGHVDRSRAGARGAEQPHRARALSPHLHPRPSVRGAHRSLSARRRERGRRRETARGLPRSRARARRCARPGHGCARTAGA